MGHAVLLFILFWITQVVPPFQAPTPETMWIEVDPKSEKNIIVESKRGEKVEQAEKDAYLSEATRKVDKEMVAKNRGKPVPQAATQTPRMQEQAQDQEQGQEVTLNKLGVSFEKILKQGAKRQDRPAWSDFAQQFGDAFPEYVKGVEEGETTALNTKEFVYFSYYKRIREQLDQAWRPLLRESLFKIFRSGRRLSSESEMTTKTLVTLDKSGEIVKVQVLEESGVRDLDSVAVDAFNKAGPFPNPPTGLVNASGQITIRWDFILRS